MKTMILNLLSLPILFSPLVWAQAHDGSDLPACHGVTDVCMKADVTATDKKSGKVVHGYQPNEHSKDGHGLWMDCVRPLAKGEAVAGVSGVSKESAKACAKAEKAAHGKKQK